MNDIQSNVSTIDPALLATMNGSRTSKGAAGADTTKEAQDRFMTLLVTQMKNQDPLNPMDNAQVTSQLAQLSTVTGIDKLNSTVASLNASYLSSQSMQAASMIGHGVLAAGSGLTLAAGKATFGVELTQPADNVEVSITDGAGKVIQKLNLGAGTFGTNMFTWDGAKDAGGIAPNGSYQFKVTATSGRQKINASPLTMGVVTSVTTSSQGVKLNVGSASDIAMADVKQIF